MDNNMELKENETPQDSVESSEESAEVVQTEDGADSVTDEQQDGADTFPRAYVEQLRKESAANRTRAKDLAERLHVAQVTATGRLADPADLPYSDNLLDPEALNLAIDELLAVKPHLAARVPRGNIGQGATKTPESFSLANFIRQGA